MYKKRIKASKRGVTFSFNSNSNSFKYGQHYKYIVDIKSGKIFIIPNKEGLKISKKKIGNKIKSLIDLRNEKVKTATEKADYLQIFFYKDKIIINSYAEERNNILSEKNSKFKSKINKAINKIINFRNKKLKKINSYILDLKTLDKVVGDEEYYQTTFFDSETSFINTQIKKEVKNTIKVISLFSGAGMLDYPFSKDKKFKIVYANDIDNGAIETYKANIGNHIHNESIKDIKISDLPQANVLIGGPPCRPFSNANRTVTRLENHSDSELIREYIRIANEGDFDMFVMENVPEILTAADGQYYNAILKALDNKFSIKSAILKDCDYGGYTTRKRAFIIGSKIGEIEIPKAKFSKENYKTVQDALKNVNNTWANYNDVTLPKEDTVFRMSFVPQGGNYLDIPKKYRTKGHQSNCYRRLSIDKPACTLVNWRKPPIIHPTENRTLNVSEAAALSGLPKEFVVKGSLGSKQQQIGNGVPQKLATLIKNIIKMTYLKYGYI